MDFYSQVLKYILEISIIDSWPEMRTALERTAAKKPRDWQLPMVACKAVCGKVEPSIPASAAIACLQIGIILVDDMLDADPRGEYQRIGEPATANLSMAFHALGLEAISRSDAPAEVKLNAMQSLSQMMLTTALGQYLDVQNPDNEEAYWSLVRTKSSPFFCGALQVGALLGGGSEEVTAKTKKFGRLYGEMIQIHDDLGDTMAVPANPDWTLGRAPLPILFAATVDHPEKARFLELRNAIQDPNVLREAQEILIHCGAVSYCIHHLIQRYQVAIDILSTIPVVSKEPLESLLKDVIIPVTNLLDEIGVDNPNGLLSQSPYFG